jgi:hypothetical protein
MADLKRKLLALFFLLAFLALFYFTCVSTFERIGRQQAAWDSRAEPVVQDMLEGRPSAGD